MISLRVIVSIVGVVYMTEYISGIAGLFENMSLKFWSRFVGIILLASTTLAIYNNIDVPLKYVIANAALGIGFILNGLEIAK